MLAAKSRATDMLGRQSKRHSGEGGLLLDARLHCSGDSRSLSLAFERPCQRAVRHGHSQLVRSGADGHCLQSCRLRRGLGQCGKLAGLCFDLRLVCGDISGPCRHNKTGRHRRGEQGRGDRAFHIEHSSGYGNPLAGHGTPCQTTVVYPSMVRLDPTALDPAQGALVAQGAVSSLTNQLQACYR